MDSLSGSLPSHCEPLACIRLKGSRDDLAASSNGGVLNAMCLGVKQLGSQERQARSGAQGGDQSAAPRGESIPATSARREPAHELLHATGPPAATEYEAVASTLQVRHFEGVGIISISACSMAAFFRGPVF